jgi:hypothetical protein
VFNKIEGVKEGILLEAGKNQSQISLLLGFHRSTISREPHRCEPLKAVENTGLEPVTSCMACKRFIHYKTLIYNQFTHFKKD